MKDKTMKRPLRVLLSWTLVFAVAAGSAVLGVLVGRSMAPAEAAATDNVPLAKAPINAGAPTAFDVNESGQTFGDYGIGLRGDPEANPELIRVVGLDGVEGYAYTTEVFGVPATSLEEARSMTEETLKEKKVPVYDQDGKTVIGVYIANAGY